MTVVAPNSTLDSFVSGADYPGCIASIVVSPLERRKRSGRPGTSADRTPTDAEIGHEQRLGDEAGKPENHCDGLGSEDGVAIAQSG